jgi:methyl-accepting chemotaxis protein-1 (serine sensor receptor)
VTFYRNLKIAIKLALLGAVLLAATMIVGLEGWHALLKTHELQIQSAQSLSQYAQAADTARVAQVEFKKQVQEWKDLLLRGADPAAFAKYRDAFGKESGTTHAALLRLKEQLSALGANVDGVDKALATHASLQDSYLDALKHYDAADPNTAHVVDGLVKGIDRAPTAAIDDIVATVMQQAQDSNVRTSEAAERSYDRFARRRCIRGLVSQPQHHAAGQAGRGRRAGGRSRRFARGRRGDEPRRNRPVAHRAQRHEPALAAYRQRDS